MGAARDVASTEPVEDKADAQRNDFPSPPALGGGLMYDERQKGNMSRRRRAEPRVIKPDPRYSNLELAKFINRVMLKGKKSTAQRVVYDALELVRQDTNQDPMVVFSSAMRNATPLVEVRPPSRGWRNLSGAGRVEDQS